MEINCDKNLSYKEVVNYFIEMKKDPEIFFQKLEEK